MVICDNCEHENPEGATICETCYTPLSANDSDENIECPNCGAKVLTQSTVCSECGSELSFVNDDLVENLPEDLLSEEDNNIDNVESDTPDTFGQKDTDSGKSQEIDIKLTKVTLFHLQTKTEINVPLELSVIHIGKINERIPPDIDVSGFPNSQVVSRVHADIVRENNNFYIEDTGSANGTYINHIPLPTGNRHKLRDGDRIALGKEDKVSFLFRVVGK